MPTPKPSGEPKELSNPFSTGGGGSNFENQVQTVFVVLMLTRGVVPCLPPWPIKKIILQGRYSGYNTDDFIVHVEERDGGHGAKMLAQIKHAVSITEGDKIFSEVIQGAWLDFQNGELFDPRTDVIALFSGPLSATDCENTRTILEWARHTETASEFFDKVNLTNFSSEAKRSKLQAFRSQLKKANKEVDLSDDELWRFLKCFHLIGYDLDVRSGSTLSFVVSLLSQFTKGSVADLLATIAKEVASFNQNAGTVTADTVSQELRTIFSQRLRQATIPDELVEQSESESTPTSHEELQGEQAEAVMFASLIGAWNERVEGDRDAVRALIEGND